MKRVELIHERNRKNFIPDMNFRYSIIHSTLSLDISTQICNRSFFYSVISLQNLQQIVSDKKKTDYLS